jgi:hypothetical protein
LRRLSVYLLTWCFTTLTFTASPAAALPSGEAIARINALRVANGIPAVVEDAALSAGCEAHARYMALNGGWDRGNAHDETPGRQGYTSEGANAARHSVLAGPGGWTDPHPWATAPYHRAQVMDPALTRTGYGEQGGYMCLQTLTEPRRALGEQIYTYPGPGAVGVAPSEIAFEVDAFGNSRVPSDLLGLPAGSATGPNLIVYAPAKLLAARLTGPRGPVPVGAAEPFVIPYLPLEPGTYTAEVDLRYPATTCTRQGVPSVGPDTVECPAGIAPSCLLGACETPLSETVRLPAYMLTHRWQFTTAGGSPVLSPPRCRPRLSTPTRIAARTPLTLRLQPCAATIVTAKVYRRSRRVLIRRSIARTQLRLATRALQPGRYRLEVTVAGARIARTFTIAV